jgi:NAD(P)-dependent dehydrogenase (short-subunit alcohol dehydrogenase family)
MKDKLEGKLALVTGAGSGIGRATALALAKKGARIIAVDIDAERVTEMQAELGTACVLAQRVDVSKREEMRALAGAVHERFGAVDVLVNNAGVAHAGGVLESKLEDWDWVVGVNLWGVVHGCHFFAPEMVRRKRGHVVNIASTFGLMAASGVAPYCTTKFAVVGLSESMRGELAPFGVGVSAVCPGLINTNIIERGRFADETMRPGAAATFRRRGRAPEQVARAVLHAIAGNVAVVPVGAEAWAAWIGKRVAPELTAIAGRRIERMARRAPSTA